MLFLNYNPLKLKWMNAFSRSYCCYGNLLGQENISMLTNDWAGLRP